MAAQLRGLAPSLIESVPLIVSELATNSIRHAGTGFELEIDVTEERIRIAVTDTGAGEPKVRSPKPSDTSGRGLRIVELLADEWGVVPSTPRQGKTVWFVVSAAKGAALR